MAWVKTTAGIEIPEPAFDSGNVTISTLVNAGRNANGQFIGQVIGNDKLKIELNWKILTPTQFQALLKIWDRSQGGSFVNAFTVYDPRTKTYRSIDMYVGDRMGKPIMITNPGTGHPKYWQDIQANLIEI
ncbi:MAG: hypothetical protein JRC93_04025 [Deltaproteobacteria bacterium]|nr:hypothetical protein [Deltaproteobacteria bacterium]